MSESINIIEELNKFAENNDIKSKFVFGNIQEMMNVFHYLNLHTHLSIEKICNDGSYHIRLNIFSNIHEQKIIGVCIYEINKNKAIVLKEFWGYVGILEHFKALLVISS